MPVNPAPPQAPQTYRCLDLIIDALIEIGMLSPGEVNNLDPDTAQWAFRKSNYLLDVWAAQRKFVPAATFQTFNLVAGHSPHTIGPNNADFLVNQRPVRIESWSLVLNASPTAVRKAILKSRRWRWRRGTRCSGITQSPRGPRQLIWGCRRRGGKRTSTGRQEI